MSILPESPATRSQLITQLTALAIQSTNLNVLTFSMRVAEIYNNAVPPLDRIVDLQHPGLTLESAHVASLSNGKKIDNLLKGKVKFPADLEEAWVDALPEPHRSNLVRALAKRYGLLGTRADELTPAQQLANLSDVLTDAGQTACALAPIFADGKIDQADLPHLANALAVVERGIADFTSLREQMRAQLPPEPSKRTKPSARK